MDNGTNNSIWKRIWIFGAVLACVFCVVFLAAQNKFTIPLTNRIVVTLLAPFQSVSSTVGDKGSNLADSLVKIATVYQENKALKQEIQRLREKNMHDDELAAENNQLRAILKYKHEHQQLQLLPAVVVARDASTWINNVVVNRGTSDGVRENMPVITPDGLVGYIIKVYGNYSIVELITDPRIVVGAMVQRHQSRVAGLVEGDPSGNMTVRMFNIPRTADVIKGDSIVTSGLGGIYPQGIAIGTVQDIYNNPGGLLKYAILKPAVDFQTLENVAIIMNVKNADYPKMQAEMQKLAGKPERRK